MKLSYILILIFLFLTLAAISSTTYFLYLNSEKILLTQVSNTLESNSQLIEENINLFLAEQVNKLQLIATQNELSNQELANMVELDDSFYEIFVVNSSGIIVASSNQTHIGVNRLSDPYFVLGKNQTYIKPVYFSPLSQRYSITFSAPLEDSVLVIRTDTKYFNKLTQERTGLGETGESLIAFMDENNGTVYLTNRLFFKQAEVVVPFVDTPLPMQYALTNREQLTLDATDYRGVNVLAASNYIESIGAGMVTKMDESEAIGLARIQLIRLSLIISAIILILAGIVSFFISYLISAPIKKLTVQVTNITSGDLSIQLEKSKIFEIQGLIDSLNRILASLKLAILRTGLTKSEFGLGEVVRAKEEAESKYKILYESSLDARMTLAPPNWNFAEGNPLALKMFNVKDERQFEALTPGDLSPKLQPDGQLSSVKAKKMIEQAMKDGKAFFEWTHKRYKGENFPTTVLLSRIGEGDKAYLQATVRELTEDFKSKNLIMEMGHLAKIGVWELDVKSGKQIWTDEVYNIHEVDKAQFSPNVHKGINFYTPESKPIIEKAVTEAIKHGKSFDVELDIITAKGNKKIVHARGMPIKEKGKVEKVRGIFQDITKIKRKIKND